jgi:hypothetical protein
MRSKVDDCLLHEHSLRRSSFCPDRLIDVEREPARLVLKEEIMPTQSQSGPLPSGPRYAALTYCWGPAEEARKQLKTTKDTLSLRRKGIPISEMTPVLRDAVEVTRALSIPYLWIDSLCILQGDAADWAKQCQCMDSVYGHSEVTIRTLASGSCNEGFLPSTTQPGLAIRLPFRSGLNPTRHGTYKIRFSVVMTNFRRVVARGGFSATMRMLIASQWQKRGWTLQEYVLSPRLLSFGRAEVLFSCSKATQHYGCLEVEGNDEEFQVGEVRQLDLDREDLYNEWIELNTNLSQRHLTKATDLFPALSGLARWFKETLRLDESDYVAGLWREDLVRQLMWWGQDGYFQKRSAEATFLLSYLSRLTSPEPYVAPSWSWAAPASARQGFQLENEVVARWVGAQNRAALSQHRRHPKTQLQASTIPSTTNPFGELVRGEGRLTIHGPVCPFTSVMTWEKQTMDIGIETWLLRAGKDCFIYCWLDWKPMEDWPFEGEIVLVAIGCCVGEEKEYREYPEDKDYTKDEAYQEDEEYQEDGEYQENGEHQDDQEYQEDTAYIKDGEYQEEEDKEDGNTDQDAMPDGTGRVVYGLLINPSPTGDGTYLRIGVFVTRHEGSAGWKFFNKCPCKTVEIM